MIKILIKFFVLISVFSCSNSTIKRNNEGNRIKNEESNTILLSKNELKELIEIVSQTKIENSIKDSLSILMFDRIHFPKTFDSIHKSFNYHQAPNLKNKNPTLDDWNSYDGNTKMWENANISYLLYEFGLTGNID